MGRHSTGAITTGEIHRIELSYLLKKRMIRKNCNLSGTISWTDGSSIGFESGFSNGEGYLRLVYTLTSRSDGEVTHHDYKIGLTSIPSNLGKGEVIYFICPYTGKRAKILYRCYGSKTWKSRMAYKNKIYYESQTCSKLWYHDIRFWSIEKELERVYKLSRKKTYKGKETRLRKRIQTLETKRNYFDRERWNHVPKSVLKSEFGRAFLEDFIS